MDTRMKLLKGLICVVLLAVLSVQAPVFAKSASVSSDRNAKQRYIVVLDDLPLASYDGRPMLTPERDVDSTRLPATATRFTGASKLDINSSASQQYLEFLDERFESFRGEALLRLGHQLKPVHRYRIAVNGFATDLTASEVRALRAMPRVKSVEFDEIQRLLTDSGPNWIGANLIQEGVAGFPATGGEGVVVGVFDTGINWDHPSFADPGEGLPPGSAAWDHVNPFGSQLGLCSQSEVLCNDKLVGVYDFVEDNANTDVIEESTDGKDNEGHGSNTSSVAVGNPQNVTLNGVPTKIAGVAPHANLVSYRVCFIGDSADPDDDGCQTSAILRAIDQALIDGVDVVNHSIGGLSHDPWIISTSTYAFLSLRTAGIFVATSAGNAGPEASSIGSPGNAPWIMSVGGATHDRVFASALENLSGGSTTPPGDLVGVSSNNGIGIRKIVHAKDFGNALCGIGEPQSGPDCASNTGISNPFEAGTFNGEIVVCDRGEYGRVEKGKNVLLAGAGGYVLANTDASLQTLVLDDLCLPSTHIDLDDGDTLRAWLDTGTGHQASISGFSIFNIPEAGDMLANFSSRGPNPSPAVDVMKPDIIAPGVAILMAGSEDGNFQIRNGTSFSSPHVAGGAALLKAVHPTWTPSMITSALVMTATPEQAIDFDDTVASVNKIGAGRPRLDQAVNAGLYLSESESDFISADPNRGGEPKNLNLPGLVDAACSKTCDFQRVVTDLAGGASWSATVEGFTNGVSVSVTPASFNLANGASQALTVSVDLTQSDLFGQWVYGKVKLTSSGLADAVLPLAVYASGGELPDEWVISTNSNSGWQEFPLGDLVSLPDATLTSGGLVVPTITTENLPEDPTRDDPYDRSAGLMTVWHTVPAETLWLHTETLDSTAVDLDLFVGRDTNGDNIAQESEELCSSTSPGKFEFCDLFSPDAGNYWVIVQNWEATNSLDEASLKSAVVGKNTLSKLNASGDGIVPLSATQQVRLSWDNVSAVPGTELLGAVGVGTSRTSPNNIGIIPVTFTKTGVAQPETIILMDGVARGLTIGAGTTHDRMALDIPAGIDSFTISSSATGADAQQNAALKMALYRLDFADAFTDAPFAVVPVTSGEPLFSASGSGELGPTLTIPAGDAVSGRWYVVLENTSSAHADVEVRADLSYTGTAIPLSGGLWEPTSRPGISQGFDYATTGGYRALLWYTYDESGEPAWYLAAGPEPVGNVWVAELERFTNDGLLQKETAVGHISVTTLAEQDNVFSFVLFGEDGSDRMAPVSPPVCPTVNNNKQSYTGLWARTAVGVGGASALANEVSQGYLHYIYDARGKPVWLLGSDVVEGLPGVEAALFQYSGYCPVCSGSAPTTQEVGVFTLEYSDEDSATWNLNYALGSPLSGSVNRTDDVDKLTVPLICQ